MAEIYMNNKVYYRAFIRLAVMHAFVTQCYCYETVTMMHKEQKASIKKILDHGGHVYHHYSCDDDGNAISTNRNTLSAWPRELLGRDWLDDVTYVILAQPNDSDIDSIRTLKRLKKLELWEPNISDQGLSHISKLVQLRTLNLNLSCSDCPGITDEGLRKLNTLHRLRYLNLNGIGITDRGMAYLKEYPSLKYCNLSLTKITDMGLEFLSTIPQIEHLDLGGNKITDCAAPVFCTRSYESIGWVTGKGKHSGFRLCCCWSEAVGRTEAAAQPAANSAGV